jgi:hypothetical protein
MRRREGEGSKGMGPILIRGVSQPGRATVTHPPWNWQVLLVVVLLVIDAVPALQVDQRGFEIAPQRHQELACERHDGDPLRSPFEVADALAARGSFFRKRPWAAIPEAGR